MREQKGNHMEHGPLFYSMSHKVSMGLLQPNLKCFVDPKVPKLEGPKFINGRVKLYNQWMIVAC